MPSPPLHSKEWVLARSRTISSALRRIAKRGESWQTHLQQAMSAAPLSAKERAAVGKAVDGRSSVPQDVVFRIALLGASYEAIRLFLEGEYRPPIRAELRRCKHDWQTVLFQAIRSIQFASNEKSSRKALEDLVKRASIPADEEFEWLLSVETHVNLHRAIQRIGRRLRPRNRKLQPAPDNSAPSGSDVPKPPNGPGQPLQLDVDVEDHARAAKDVADEEFGSEIKCAIAKLSPAECRAIGVRFQDGGWSFRKMARVWGGSSSGWNDTYKRGLNKLRDDLDGSL